MATASSVPGIDVVIPRQMNPDLDIVGEVGSGWYNYAQFTVDSVNNRIIAFMPNETTHYWIYDCRGDGWTEFTTSGLTSPFSDYMNSVYVSSNDSVYYTYSNSAHKRQPLGAGNPAPVSLLADGETYYGLAHTDTALNALGNDDYIYGLNKSKKIRRYSIAGNTWTDLATHTDVRSNQGNMKLHWMYKSDPDKLVSFTNYGTNGYSTGADIVIYSISGNSYTYVQDVQMPEGYTSSCFSASSDGKYVYFMVNKGQAVNTYATPIYRIEALATNPKVETCCYLPKEFVGTDSSTNFSLSAMRISDIPVLYRYNAKWNYASDTNSMYPNRIKSSFLRWVMVDN